MNAGSAETAARRMRGPGGASRDDGSGGALKPLAVPGVCRATTAAAGEVWAVLADGWSYPCWVVGAARMRSVGADWPAVGAVMHHSVGSWPLMIDDRTVVTASRPGRSLALRGRAQPFGEADIAIELVAAPGGGCEIVMREDVAAGPARRLPQAVRGPLIRIRNAESLRRLALIAERGTG